VPEKLKLRQHCSNLVMFRVVLAFLNSMLLQRPCFRWGVWTQD